MKAVRVLILILGCFPFLLAAQQTTFQKVYFQNDVRAHGVIALPDGGFGIAGYFDFQGGNEQAFVARLTCEGDVDWVNVYGSATSANSLGPEVILASDGDIVVVHNNGGVFSHDVLVIKVGQDGTDRWVARVGGNGDDVGMDITETWDRGFAVGGRTDSYVPGNQNYSNMYLFKLDSTGALLWTQSIGDADAFEEIGGLVEADDRGLVFSGRAFFRNAFHAVLMKTDSVGNVLWTKGIGGDDQTRGIDLQKTPDGGYVLGGYTFLRNGSPIADPDFWVAKANANGDILWSNAYGTVPDDYELGYHLAIDHNGGIVMVGITRNFPFTGFVSKKFFLINLDENGNLQQSVYYGSGNDDYPAFTRTYDGGYALLGFTGNNIYSLPGTFGPYLLKMDENFLTGCNEQIVTPQTNVFNPGLTVFDTTLNVQTGGVTYTPPSATQGSLSDTTLCMAIDTLLIPDFSFEVDTCNPLFVTFTDDSQGNIDSYLWDFGDGTTDTVPNPTHTYAGAGTYTVTLTLTKDYCPKTASSSQSVTVQGGVLVADFSCRPEDLLDPLNYVGERIYFTDASQGNILTWEYLLGDGNSAFDPNPVHVYDSAANYTVTLIVTDDRQCQDTATKELDVELKILIPNVITPNGDGNNDVLKILGLREYCLTIYDRWGRKVFTNDCNKDLLWDGSLQDSQNFHQSTTYYFTIEGVDYEDNEVSEGGNVTIIR